MINKNGKKFFTQNLILISCNKNKLFPQTVSSVDCCYGIKASKKIGHAALRNKVKRRIRAVLQNLEKTQPNYLHQSAFLIVPKASCAKINFNELQNEIDGIIRKAS